MRASLATTPVLLLSLAATALAQGRGAAAYIVIVNPANSVSSVDRQFLADAFLKKTTQWSDGQVIRPVELKGSSPVRRGFSQDVMGRSIESLSNYWQQRIFSGDVPPPELGDDEEVVRYVLKHPGAIGYVSASADVGAARVLAIR